MSDAVEDLRQELQAAQRALAEALARCESHDAEHQAVANELESARRKVEQAHREWMAALDVVDAPIFLHDKQFRILRCNRAYQQRAGLSFKQIIGQPYYEVFPKTGAPLAGCLRVMKKAEAAADEEEIVIGGTNIRSRTYSVYGEQGNYLHSVHIFEDITEHKRAEALLGGQKQVLEMIAVGATLPEVLTALVRLIEAQSPGMLGSILLLDEDGHVRHGAAPSLPSEYIAAVDGELIGPCAGSCGTAAYRKGPVFVEDIATDPLWEAYKAAALPHGLRACWATPIFDTQHRVLGTFAMYFRHPGLPQPEHLRLIDIATQTASITISRHRAEEALRKSEAKFRAIIESSPVAMAVNDMHQNVTLLNRKFIETFGYTLADIPTLAEWWQRAYPDPAYRQRVAQEWQAAEEKVQRDRTELEPLEYKVTCKGGNVRDIRFSMAPMDTSSLVIFYDITERKQAEAALRESEEKLLLFVHHAPSAIAMFDRDMHYIAFSHRWLADYGLGEQELAGRSHYEVFPDLPERWKDVHRRCLGGAIEKCDEDLFPRAGGQVDWVRWEIHPWQVSDGSIGGIIIFSEVITERKQAEVALNHANRALATLSAVNRSLVRATREDELLQEICGAIVEQKGYRMAWVGYKQDDENKSVKIMARAGHDAGYLDTAQITWAENERGMGPSGCAIRSGATQLCRDVAQDPRFLPWREKALERGYAASIALPLLNGDRTVFGVLNVYALEVNAFTPSEVGLLEEMAGDLAYGVLALHTRRERNRALEQSRQHLAQLHDSLEDTVRAIASIVELRDPYTSGHQAKVSGLAAAIAGQMGLSEEQVHAIHLAGIVHDLGKIKIPAEILSKPGRITDIEYSLIKIHPQAGYDILKGINFPWPIAQMVLQHHERLDGSGYPQGLKGDAILLESRILCVADVVEAMSSHRPYRPGLGIEVALAEITGKSGKLYDPQAVDACQTLFLEQGYSL